MKDRCLRNTDKGYDGYGGRGITICEEWINSYESFIRWGMSNGWEKGLLIDRINNDGNYEPANCRFVTIGDSNRNTRRTRLIEYNGKTQCLAAWSEELDKTYLKIFKRLKRGWSIEKTFNTK